MTIVDNSVIIYSTACCSKTLLLIKFYNFFLNIFISVEIWELLMGSPMTGSIRGSITVTTLTRASAPWQWMGLRGLL